MKLWNVYDQDGQKRAVGSNLCKHAGLGGGEKTKKEEWKQFILAAKATNLMTLRNSCHNKMCQNKSDHPLWERKQ